MSAKRATSSSGCCAVKVSRSRAVPTGTVGGRIAWALAAAFYADHMHYRGITFVIGGILGALLLH